jgi:energy-coupling factor transport system ATP-binding protein
LAVSDVFAAELQHLSYWYAGSSSPSLDNVDVCINSNFTLLSGDSGSGKSTLLRVFNGLVPQFHGGKIRGSASVFGRDILTTPTRALAADVGFLFQDPELQTVYSTVESDVAFGLENMAVPRAAMFDRVDEALQRCGLEGLRRRRVDTLSGGERQRLALAGLIALRPRLLALDEPLAQLDAEGAQSFLTTLDDLVAGGIAVVMAEHRQRHVLPRADRSLSIQAGRVSDSGEGDRASETVSEPSWTALGSGGEARVSGAGAAPLRPRGLDGPVSSAAVPIWQLCSVSAGPAGKAVLTGVDLAGHASEVVVLTGPNGGGKTTLLRTIAELIAPLDGRVERAPGRVAYLPQNPTSLLHRPTVRAEIELTLRRADTHESADAVLEAFGLSEVAERYPRDLSTGQRQRTALAAVLAGSPSIALLDEPTRGMDDASRASLQHCIERLTEQGGSVVLATHDTDLAASVADRIVRVGDGRAVEAMNSVPVPA